MKSKDQSRIIIENISPKVENGLHPIRRVVGEEVIITADVFADRDDVIQCSVLFQHENDKKWSEVRMHHIGNDTWQGRIIVKEQGHYLYRIQAWEDHPLNWQKNLNQNIDHGQNVKSQLLKGIDYLSYLKKVTNGLTTKMVSEAELSFQNEASYADAIEAAQSNQLNTLFIMHPQKTGVVESRSLHVYVDRQKARFSTWYEFFPRSASKKIDQHGTFKDCERLMPRIADMGFDVVYFPPIHPIGEVNRRGKNKATIARSEDVGSPWAIGSKYGGHKRIHPELGSLEDFRHLLYTAKKNGIEIAMDFALQTAPDHPYRKEKEKWYGKNLDETQEILPIHFGSSYWRSMWDELLKIMIYWIEQGVRIFRVTHSHERPFLFWGWLIQEVKHKYPDVLFLSEAITKPKVMEHLAKQGFTQSYTYFTLQNTKAELQEYMHTLTKTNLKEFFNPNFWPNTPDTNPLALQSNMESSYLARHFLAATLSASYGIYGPVFELMAGDAIPGEEYLNPEEYQIRYWDWDIKTKISHLISKINRIRKRERALQQTNNIEFLETENDQLIAYVKWEQEKQEFVLCVVNLDPYYTQKGSVHIPRHYFSIAEDRVLNMKDLITGKPYVWPELRNNVELSPEMPYHLFKVSW